jgi:tetratricopeptide (TPR) repeat protein
MKRTFAVLILLILVPIMAIAETVDSQPIEANIRIVTRGTNNPIEIEILKLINDGNMEAAYKYVSEKLSTLMDTISTDEWEATKAYCTTEELYMYNEILPETKTSDLHSDCPLLLYYYGFLLVENGQYEEASQILETSLYMNPMRITTAMELTDCIMAMRDHEKAKTLLEYTHSLCLLPEDFAWYYRRLGFLLAELEKYEDAKHCQLYSLIFEENDIAYGELAYADSVLGNDPFDYKQPSEKLKQLTDEAVQYAIDSEITFALTEEQKTVLTLLSNTAMTDTINLYDRALTYYSSIEEKLKPTPSL